ncbi:MAG: 16S rRNA (cytidine(1402)-2'-O)-methyltransferase, partial [Parafannyhessea umbonata]|nr:16S rRNA (cytidine(1402)-2'-O)-methyltransferase [Parafannyhessea umbonata]
FFFEGFLPRKAGAMRARLEELSVVPGALVVYESPHRVATTLARIAEVLPDREVALVRELTKVHEECLRGRAPELAALVAERDEVKGECVVVIGAPTEEELLGRRDAASRGTQSLEEAIRAGLEEGEPKTKLAKRLAKSFSLAKAEVYDAILRESER